MREKLEDQTEIQEETQDAPPDNLRIWNKVKDTDKKFTKKVNYGRKFDTIAAYWQFRQATELWGPLGQGWDITNPVFIIDASASGLSILIGTAALWYVEDGKKITTSEETSAVALVDKENKVDVDAWKKLKTELITKSLSRLGFSADIFMGSTDVDSKYTNTQTSWDKDREGVADTIELVRKDFAKLAKEMGFEKDSDAVFRKKFASIHRGQSINQTTVSKLRRVVDDVREDWEPPTEGKKK